MTSTSKDVEDKAKASAITYLKSWGESSVPPTVLATLITAQHARPPQFLPLLFPPVFLFSSYLNIYDFKIDSAGISAAWASLYMILARRRKQALMSKWSPRGIIRGTTLGICAVQVVSGGMVYAIGRRDREERERDAGGPV